MAAGHRPPGVQHGEPEHTLAAYMRAIDEGADGVECDVRLTADRHLVCVHDRRVNRTSNGRGIVSTLELADLEGLDWGSWKAAHARRRRDARPRPRTRPAHPAAPARRAVTTDRAGPSAWPSRPSTRPATPGSSSASWPGCWRSSGCDGPPAPRPALGADDVVLPAGRAADAPAVPRTCPAVYLVERSPCRCASATAPCRGASTPSASTSGSCAGTPRSSSASTRRGHEVYVWTVDEPGRRRLLPRARRRRHHHQPTRVRASTQSRPLG